MQTLDQMPDQPEGQPARKKKEGLRVHQIRVLRALGSCKGALSRSKIGDKTDLSNTVVARALGYEDAEKRKKFEDTDPAGGYPSLITLKYIKSTTLDIDGLLETTYELTPLGRIHYLRTKDVVIPPPKD